MRNKILPAKFFYVGVLLLLLTVVFGCTAKDDTEAIVTDPTVDSDTNSQAAAPVSSPILIVIDDTADETTNNEPTVVPDDVQADAQPIENMFWRCAICGDLHYGKQAPEICPTCGYGRDKALQINEADFRAFLKNTTGKKYWLCSDCGELHYGKLAPESYDETSEEEFMQRLGEAIDATIVDNTYSDTGNSADSYSDSYSDSDIDDSTDPILADDESY